jgi:hypothetical protein
MVKVIFNIRLFLSYVGKIIGIGILHFLSLTGVPCAEEPVGLPTNVCHGDFCGPDQQDIWSRFQVATGLKLDLIPNIYSGICYHKSRVISPHSPHFGGILIDKVGENVFFRGRFKFYFKTNPYEDMDIEAARGEFQKQFEVKLYDLFAYAEASDTIAPFRYWFRQEANTNDLLLVGYFGFGHTMLCVLECN